MSARFEKDGVSFQYPDTWELSREESDNGWTVAVQSPDTAFFMVSFDAGMPEPALMADAALEALRGEYPDLEADEALSALAGQPAVGRDVHFFSLDLTNTCWMRGFYAGGGTVLAYWQANDLELGEVEPVLRAIGASLKIADDE